MNRWDLRALAGLVIVVAILFAISEAGAYHLIGGYWQRPFTTCEDPRMLQSVALWQEHAAVPFDHSTATSPDISCTVDQQSSGIGGYAAPFYNHATGEMISCDIHINSLYANSLVVWVHELGHCLGLAHSCEGGQTNCSLLERQAVMAYDGGTGGINADDDAAIKALYGPPAPPPPPPVFKLVAPGAARD